MQTIRKVYGERTPITLEEAGLPPIEGYRVLVIGDLPWIFEKELTVRDRGCSSRDVVNTVVQRIFRECGPDGHVLTEGYRVASGEHHPSSIAGFEFRGAEENELVSFWKSQQRWMDEIGICTFCSVLRESTLVMREPEEIGGGYRQMTGPFPKSPTRAEKETRIKSDQDNESVVSPPVYIDTEAFLQRHSRLNYGHLKHRHRDPSSFVKMSLMRLVRPESMWFGQKRQFMSRVVEPLCRQSLSAYTANEQFEELFGLHPSVDWFRFLFNFAKHELLGNHFALVDSETGPVVMPRSLYREQVRDFVSNVMEQSDPVVSPRDDAKMQRRRFGVAPARLVAKRNQSSAKFRMITNLGARALDARFSMNDMVRPALRVLQSRITPESVGAAIFHLGDVHAKMSAYFAHQKIPVFGVSMDVVRCYDRILQDKMMLIVGDLLKEPKYEITMPGTRYVFDRYEQRVRRSKHPPGPKTLSVGKPTVTKTYDRSYIYNLIEEVVCRAYFSLNGKRRRLRQGIPQGSALSTVLCNLYMGAFERESWIKDFMQSSPERGKDELLMRAMDDYLFLSPHKHRVEAFAERMQQGDASFNCFANKSKTRRLDKDGSITWYGIDISTRGEIRIHLRPAVNVSNATRPRKVLPQTRPVRAVLRATFRARCHPIFFQRACFEENVAWMFAACRRRVRHLTKRGASQLITDAKEVLDARTLKAGVPSLSPSRLVLLASISFAEWFGEPNEQIRSLARKIRVARL